MTDPHVGDDSATAPRTQTTILLVEDEASVREFMKKALEVGGHQVLEASNGFEALSVISRKGPESIDLVLTDVVMPGMSGWLLADTIASKYQMLKVLFMSGNSELVRVFNGGQMEGATLHKPFSPATLLERVRQVLESKKAAAA
jgi:DNA-binding response OmpR family regulator